MILNKRDSISLVCNSLRAPKVALLGYALGEQRLFSAHTLIDVILYVLAQRKQLSDV